MAKQDSKNLSTEKKESQGIIAEILKWLLEINFHKTGIKKPTL